MGGGGGGGLDIACVVSTARCEEPVHLGLRCIGIDVESLSRLTCRSHDRRSEGEKAGAGVCEGLPRQTRRSRGSQDLLLLLLLANL